MGDGEDEAAIDEAQAGAGENRIAGQAVGAIGVLQQRTRTVARAAFAIDQGYRHEGAVARRRE